MIPDSDPAVLEAQRRRLAREHNLVTQPGDATLDYALRRRRKYWTWLALVPGLLGTLGYGGLYLVAFLSVTWVPVCTIRIVLTFRGWTLGKRIAAVPVLYVPLLAGGAVVFFVAHVVAEAVEMFFF